MYIHTQVLEKYCEKRGNPVTISFNIDQEDMGPYMRITGGRYEQWGSHNEFLDFTDIAEILRINNIVGEGSLVASELEKKGGYDKQQNVDDLIYDTLAKYVNQLFCGGIGKILYPELVPLEKHKRDYFRNVD